MSNGQASSKAVTSPNWVEQRAQRDKVLDQKASLVWNDVRAALQDAHDSYVFHYARNTAETEFKLEKINRLRVSRKLIQDAVQRMHDVLLDVLVSFDDSIPAINVTYGQNVQQNSIVFEITSDEQDAFVFVEGNRLSVEDVSRRILEPLLFPEKRRLHPFF